MAVSKPSLLYTNAVRVSGVFRYRLRLCLSVQSGLFGHIRET